MTRPEPVRGAAAVTLGNFEKLIARANVEDSGEARIGACLILTIFEQFRAAMCLIDAGHASHSLDVEGWLGSTALLLIVLYFLIPALSSFHVFSLTAGALALVSGFYSTIRELFERHMSWLAPVLPVTYFLWGVYVLFHLASR